MYVTCITEKIPRIIMVNKPYRIVLMKFLFREGLWTSAFQKKKNSSLGLVFFSLT